MYIYIYCDTLTATFGVTMILTVWLVVPPNTVQSSYVTSRIVEVLFHAKLVLQNIKDMVPICSTVIYSSTLYPRPDHSQPNAHFPLTHPTFYIYLITVTGSSHTHIHDIPAIYCNFRRWSKAIPVSTWITIWVSPKCIKTWWKCLQVPISTCLSFNHITYQCM